jgi:hypothetical protein
MEKSQEPVRVFEIAFIAPVLPDIWTVQGRAYEEINTGDTVGIEVLGSSNEKVLARFKVVAAATYGNLVSGLDEGRTGGITIVAQSSKADIPTLDSQVHAAKFVVR